MESPSIPPSAPDTPGVHDSSRQAAGRPRHRFQAFLNETWMLANDRHGRWKRRWIMASGAAFAVILALSIGDISWRTAVMVVAAGVMLAMSGDMLDRVQQ